MLFNMAVKDDLPDLEHIIYIEPRGIRHRYDDPSLMAWADFLELGRQHRESHPRAVDERMAMAKPDDLAALVIRQVVDRSGIDPASIDDVYFGASNQAGEDNRNVARMSGSKGWSNRTSNVPAPSSFLCSSPQKSCRLRAANGAAARCTSMPWFSSRAAS